MQANGNNWSTEKIILVSAAAGLIVLLLLLLWLGFAFWSSFIWGVVVGVIVYIILMLNFAGEADEDAGHGYSGQAGTAAAGASAAAAAGSGVDAAAVSAANADDAAAAADATAAASEAAMAAEDASVSEAPASTDGGAAADEPVVKPTAPLAGEAELASRKGTWKYGGDDVAGSADDDAADPSEPPAPAAETAAEKAAADAAHGEDYDGDGVREGTDEGSKPVMLSAARDGGADNLKEIKGVGPAMEKMLNGMGVYHFDQVAAWTADEVAWVDANLKGFKGRVSRDNWVDQAKILMTGAETEFSQRVEDGKVY